MITVRSDIAIMPVIYVARCMSKGIPYGQAAPAFLISSFDLIRSSRRPPAEIVWELENSHVVVPPEKYVDCEFRGMVWYTLTS